MAEANYDENLVPKFDIIDPLSFSGTPVDSPDSWVNNRQKILSCFEEHVYGKTPQKPFKIDFEVLEDAKSLHGGIADRKQIRIVIGTDKGQHAMDLLVYLPAQRKGPIPVFLGLNFWGNQSVHEDQDIIIPEVVANRPANNDRAKNRKARGGSKEQWPVEFLIKEGYALATMSYDSIDPDFDDGYQNGIHPLFYDNGQSKPRDDEWGSIGAWAWGLSRCMDYIEQDESLDEQDVAVMGHSRLGKTALWAGAQDERFKYVISNNSGCGGAALSKRCVGETVAKINDTFPHWFCNNFRQYNDNEQAMAFDQHMLISLMAPRPVYVASAEDDQWADPKGEFLSARHAHDVYAMVAKEGISQFDMPAVNETLTSRIGYHIRSGGHDVLAFDWEAWINWRRKNP